MLAHHQAVVMCQLSRVLRHATLAKVVGGGHHHPSVGRQLAHHHPAFGRLPEPHGGVETAGAQIGPLLHELELHLHRRMTRLEVGDRRCHPAPAEAQRAGQADQPARLSHTFLQFGLQIGKPGLQLACPRAEDFAFVGEPQATCGAMEEPQAQA